LLLCITVKLVHKIMRLVLTCALRRNMTHMYLSSVVANLLCRRSHKVRSGNVPTYELHMEWSGEWSEEWSGEWSGVYYSVPQNFVVLPFILWIKG
jgi:hypothetical protein